MNFFLFSSFAFVGSTLPLDPTKPKPSLNAWSFVKSAIGKDLSKVTLPVFFNEPLSMLQRMCEDVEYIELLSLASRAGAGDPTPSTHPAVECAREKGWDLNQVEMLDYDEAGLIRMMLVSAYAMSNYSSTVGRTSKPFNPILVRRDEDKCADALCLSYKFYAMCFLGGDF